MGQSRICVRSSSTSKSKVQAVQLKECGGADNKEVAKKPEVHDVLRKECEGTGIKECAEECSGTVSVNGKRVQYPKIKNGRYTLDWWKCYLDSCASRWTRGKTSTWERRAGEITTR